MDCGAPPHCLAVPQGKAQGGCSRGCQGYVLLQAAAEGVLLVLQLLDQVRTSLEGVSIKSWDVASTLVLSCMSAAPDKPVQLGSEHAAWASLEAARALSWAAC